MGVQRGSLPPTQRGVSGASGLPLLGAARWPVRLGWGAELTWKTPRPPYASSWTSEALALLLRRMGSW